MCSFQLSYNKKVFTYLVLYIIKCSLLPLGILQKIVIAVPQYLRHLSPFFTHMRLVLYVVILSRPEGNFSKNLYKISTNFDIQWSLAYRGGYILKTPAINEIREIRTFKFFTL